MLILWHTSYLYTSIPHPNAKSLLTNWQILYWYFCLFYLIIIEILASVSCAQAKKESGPALLADMSWPSEELALGQVSGVAFNPLGQPYLVHRANRTWDWKCAPHASTREPSVPRPLPLLCLHLHFHINLSRIRVFEYCIHTSA